MEAETMLSKDDLEARDERWMHIARQNGHRCSVCGDIPCYDDREVYFETKMCSYHAHTFSKDD